MNATPGLDFRAIGVGAAVGIGASLVTSVMWMLFPMSDMAGYFGIVLLASHLIGALIDIGTGAIAGWLARRRGSLHGLFAGLIANIVSTGVGYALTLLRTDYGRTVEQVVAYLVAVVPWQIVGVTLATIAGTLAVRLQARAGTPSA